MTTEKDKASDQREMSEAEMKSISEYQDLCHGVQTGVAFMQEQGSRECEPKHLHTGVNIAMRDHSSLVALLVRKGLIANEEYATAIRDGMKLEVADYEDRCNSCMPIGSTTCVKLH